MCFFAAGGRHTGFALVSWGSGMSFSDRFEGHAERGSRSHMNATFRLKDEAHAEAFDVSRKAAKINGLKGHRSVGGYRASMYNALPLESVQVLVDVMAAFERSHG